MNGNEHCIDDEIPFDIPDSWVWTRLGNLFYHNTGKALNSSNSEGQKLTYITTSNLYWDRFELDKLKEMPFTDSEIDKFSGHEVLERGKSAGFHRQAVFLNFPCAGKIFKVGEVPAVGQAEKVVIQPGHADLLHQMAEFIHRRVE